ncbi:MAG: glutaminase [Pseudomonadota bacterium]
MTDDALQRLLDEIAARMADETERGTPAQYIPELAKADVGRFGIAVAPVSGGVTAAGDADLPFSIQSVSKVFTLILALERVGGGVWQRVGREPSGNAFNSIVQLEHERGIPRNPFINAGAIVIADLLAEGRGVEETVDEILAFLRHVSGDAAIDIDPAVAASERRTGHRNVSLASFMAAEGNLKGRVKDVLAVYYRHCAIAVSCRQLAAAGRFLAAAGAAGCEQVVPAERARRLAALMLTCGHYDASGEFAYRVGIPAKSGVGGGILGVVPGIAAVAAWCPGLDARGSSLLASRAFEILAARTGWSVFATRAG